jgi:hypothetical protein
MRTALSSPAVTISQTVVRPTRRIFAVSSKVRRRVVGSVGSDDMVTGRFGGDP